MIRDFAKKNISRLQTMQAVVALIIILIIGSLVDPVKFLTVGNLLNVTRQALTVALLAYGMAFVVISGSIDLSVASGLIMGAFLCLLFSKYSVVLGILAACAGCMVIGFLNAVLINEFKFPSMIATFAMALLINGTLFLINKGAHYQVNELPLALEFLGFGDVFGIPFATIVLVLMCVFCHYLITRVPAIRYIYAVGGNAEAAAMMGVNVKRTRYIAHILCGLLTGLAGVNMGSRLGSAVILGGAGFDMNAIASIVIGGIAMSGGRGKMIYALIGSLVMTMLSNVFTIQKWLNYNYEQSVIGILLIIVLLIQVFSSTQADGANKSKNSKKIIET